MIAIGSNVFQVPDWSLVYFIRIGGESLAVAQNTYAVKWFQGRELNMVFGLQLSFSRVVSSFLKLFALCCWCLINFM